MATGLMEDGKVKPAQPPLNSVVQVRNGDRQQLFGGAGVLQVCSRWRCSPPLHHLEPEAVLFGILASCCSFITTDCQIVLRVSGQCGAVAFLSPVALCWRGGSVNARGLEVPPKGSVGPVTQICLALLSSRSPPQGEAVGCSRQSDSSPCAAVNPSHVTSPSLNPPGSALLCALAAAARKEPPVQ